MSYQAAANQQPVTAALPRPAASERVCVRWRIDRGAFHAAQPGLIGRSGSASVILEVCVVPPPACKATVTLIDAPHARIPLEPGDAPGRARFIDDAGRSLQHVAVPGLLELTRHSGSGRVLFARCALLGALNLPGGRYELID